MIYGEVSFEFLISRQNDSTTIFADTNINKKCLNLIGSIEIIKSINL